MTDVRSPPVQSPSKTPSCVMIPRAKFFSLLEQHPSLVRGLLAGLTHRLVELTNRLAELSGGTVERRFARLFLKLSSEMGRQERGGTFVPLSLSRQELADMTGTTIETCIRIMSRWGKQDTGPHLKRTAFVDKSRAADYTDNTDGVYGMGCGATDYTDSTVRVVR